MSICTRQERRNNEIKIQERHNNLKMKLNKEEMEETEGKKEEEEQTEKVDEQTRMSIRQDVENMLLFNGCESQARNERD